MKKLPLFMVLLLLFSHPAGAQEAPKLKKFMIFPIRVVEKGAPDKFSQEIGAALGVELAREGDIELLSGGQFVSAVQDRRVDPARLLRIAERAGSDFAAWGTLTKLEGGYSAEFSVVSKDQPTKPRLFTADGKDMEDLVAKFKDAAAEIGSVVLKRPKVAGIEIEGNTRVQKEAILNKIDMKPGKPFKRSSLGEEIKEIYSMGYFDDVRINADEAPDGEVTLRISVKERPSIKEIDPQGNSVLSKDEILDALSTKQFAVLSTEKIRSDIQKLKKMYEKHGYYEPRIDYEVKELNQNQATLVFKIDEGQKSFLTELILDGRDKLSESDIRKLLTVKEKGWFWFLDESGTFTREKLEENRIRIAAAYLENGFIGIQVGAPKVDIKDGAVKVTYAVREGDRYQVRKVSVEGDLIVPEDQLLSVLQVKPRTWFKRSLMAEDIKELVRIYNNDGYAYADVEPLQRVNQEHKFVDLTYKVTKGDRVTIERVDIAGNERTRDKIIRRQIAISEGDQYNADRFEATKKRLEATEFFEAVKMKTAPGSKPDRMNVTVEVMEKKTGTLSAGLGYSSQDGAMGNINLQERNLFGLGIVANGRANISGRRNSYEAGLTYPWIFDTALSGTLRGYRGANKELSYMRDTEGFSAHLNYPVYEFWMGSLGFARDSAKLSNFDQSFGLSVREYYRRAGAKADKFFNTSENSLSLGFVRDTRNNSVIPTAGSKIQLSNRYAGLGADVFFASHNTEVAYYQHLFWKAIAKGRATGSVLWEVGQEPIPFDRRILLGGPMTIRGYQYGEIGPRDRYGNILGGDRSLLASVECLFPIVEQLKLNGVLFADAGNAWNVSDSVFMRDVKAGVGLGIRWMSPMGPLRVEYGWKVRPEPGETPGAVAFTMGQMLF